VNVISETRMNRRINPQKCDELRKNRQTTDRQCSWRTSLDFRVSSTSIYQYGGGRLNDALRSVWVLPMLRCGNDYGSLVKVLCRWIRILSNGEKRLPVSTATGLGWRNIDEFTISNGTTSMVKMKVIRATRLMTLFLSLLRKFSSIDRKSSSGVRCSISLKERWGTMTRIILY
jgi:hypothetical protein